MTTTQPAFDPTVEWEDGPMTVRNRRVLYFGLMLVAEHLEMDVAFRREHGVWDDVTWEIDEFPKFVRHKEPDWWDGVIAAAWRMAEAMRSGVKWNPRTVAEAAVLKVAVDQIEDTQITVESLSDWNALPKHEDDGDYTEVVPALTGDTDIVLLWVDHMDGIGDPTNQVNIANGMGDYQPSSWFKSQFWDDDMESSYV